MFCGYHLFLSYFVIGVCVWFFSFFPFNQFSLFLERHQKEEGMGSDLPAKSILPVSISARMQPAAHMSMALV